MAQTHHANAHLGDDTSSLSLGHSHSPDNSSLGGPSPLATSPGVPGAGGSSGGGGGGGGLGNGSGAGGGGAEQGSSVNSSVPPYLHQQGRQNSSDSSYGQANSNSGQSTEDGQIPGQAPGQTRQGSGGASGLNSFGSLSISSSAPQQQGQGQARAHAQSQSQAYANLGLGSAREETVPVGFDEGILRGLCDMDCALPLLADRIKQSIASCKQVAVFFRSRADIEEKYARSLVELGRNTSDVYSRADCKSGTFVTAYQGSLKLQESLAHNRLRFSQRLNEMSDELLSLAREGEKMRKQHKENGSRYQAILQESETAMDKAKARFDSTAEELERVLVAKEGESMKESGMRSSASTSGGLSSAGSSVLGGIGGGSGGNGGGSGSLTGSSGSGGSGAGAGSRKAFNKAIKSGGMLFKGKGPASMAKHEDDTRARMAQASETFRKAVLESQTLRQEYFNFQLPKILRLLKECADELDMGTQYHLTRFAFLYETTIVGDGQALNPMGADDSLGLKHLFESIDNRTDFKSYMQNYAVARGAPRGPRRDGPYEDGFLPPMPQHHPPAGHKPLTISAPFPTSDPLPANLGSMGTNGAATPSSAGLGGQAGAGAMGGSGNGSQDPSRSQSFSSTQALGPGGQAHAQGYPGQYGQQDGSGSAYGQQPHAMAQHGHHDANYVPPGIPAAGGATYGVDLGEQLARDGGEVPRVVEKCVQAVEAYGLENTGIYRLSGTTSKVQALKRALDTDIVNTDVMSDDWSADINVVSGALKLWFRELPEPLLTYGLYHLFIEAARHENDRLRHIKLHEQVNELPDPNYATLKFFMGHLDRIRRKESVNQMSISNLSIVFGPTLLGAPPEEGGLNLEHMSFQCKAIETILEKYSEIFVEEDEGEA